MCFVSGTAFDSRSFDFFCFIFNAHARKNQQLLLTADITIEVS